MGRVVPEEQPPVSLNKRYIMEKGRPGIDGDEDEDAESTCPSEGLCEVGLAASALARVQEASGWSAG